MEAHVGWKDEDVRNALQYVIDEQEELMALFVAKEIERDPHPDS
jgi:hypothetical protein